MRISRPSSAEEGGGAPHVILPGHETGGAGRGVIVAGVRIVVVSFHGIELELVGRFLERQGRRRGRSFDAGVDAQAKAGATDFRELALSLAPGIPALPPSELRRQRQRRRDGPAQHHRSLLARSAPRPPPRGLKQQRRPARPRGGHALRLALPGREPTAQRREEHRTSHTQDPLADTRRARARRRLLPQPR